ncbi:hypothetical protein HYX05_01010 [Candidatus Woesearchaeota archaeon]|nr:hypothetical protein [Candidatus Woesearchaeota archaeon]
MGYKRSIKFLTSKKAMDIELWFNVFELVIVFSAGLVLLDTVNSEARGTAFEKNYFARDSALLINTIYASPGNIEYYYPNQTAGFIFDFKQNKVSVYEQHELVEGGVVKYPFAEDATYTFFYTKLSPRNLQEHKIVYSKNKDSINVNN